MGILSLYGEEDEMATSSGRYVGIDVSKDKLDVAVLHAVLGGVFGFHEICIYLCTTVERK